MDTLRITLGSLRSNLKSNSKIFTRHNLASFGLESILKGVPSTDEGYVDSFCSMVEAYSMKKAEGIDPRYMLGMIDFLGYPTDQREQIKTDVGILFCLFEQYAIKEKED